MDVTGLGHPLKKTPEIFTQDFFFPQKSPQLKVYLVLLAGIPSTFLANHFSSKPTLIFVKWPPNTTWHNLFAPVAEQVLQSTDFPQGWKVSSSYVCTIL